MISDVTKLKAEGDAILELTLAEKYKAKKKRKAWFEKNKGKIVLGAYALGFAVFSIVLIIALILR